VQYTKRLDSNSKLYIPKVLREAGFNNTINIIPNSNAFLCFPQNVDLTEVLESIMVIKKIVEIRIKRDSAVN
jgi:hypothetical protein